MDNESQIKFLSRLDFSSNMPHAILLTGPGKLRKITVAVNFIKWILGRGDKNERNLHDADFIQFQAGKCECISCFKVDKRLHPDFISIESISTKIEEIRDFREKFSLSPAVAHIKSAIIFNADRLRNESANALLKFLEEPRGKSLIFLIAPSRRSVLDTISSRASELRFSFEGIGLGNLYSRDEVNQKLKEIEILERGLLYEKFAVAQNYNLTNKDELAKLFDIWLMNLRKRLAEGGDAYVLNLIKKIFKIKRIISATNANPQILLEELVFNLI